MSCEQARELAPELTIGIADGQQRDAALRHAATCPDCRQLISGLSSVIDDLLLLAPSHEPPRGFAARTVASMSPPAAVPESMRDTGPSPARRARQPRRALARAGTRLRWAAAAACLAAAGAGGRPDRPGARSRVTAAASPAARQSRAGAGKIGTANPRRAPGR